MSWTNRLSQWLVRYRNVLLVINIIVAALLATQISKVQVGSTDDDIGYEDNYYIIQNKLLEEVFPKDSRSFLLVVASKSGELLNNSNISIIRKITEEIEILPHVLSVRSLTNSNLLSVNGDELELKPLIPEQSEFTEKEIQEISKRLLEDEDLSALLISEDLSLSPIIVTYQLPEGLSFDDTVATQAELLRQSNTVLESLEINDDQVRLFPMGWSINFLYKLEEMEKVLYQLTPLVLLVSFLAFWFLIRSFKALLLGLVSLFVLSEVFVLGIIGKIGIPLDQLSSIAPAIVIMVMGADSIHVMSRFFQNLRNGQDQEKAMIHALDFNLLPLLLTTITTSFGFLSLNFSDVDMVRDLGNITGMGAIVALIITLTAMPGLLLLTRNNTPVEPLTLAIIMKKLARAIIKNEKAIFYTMLGFILISITGFGVLEVNYVPGKSLDKGHSVRDNVDFVDDRIPSRYPVMYVFDSGKEEGIYDPEFLKKIDEFSQWNRAQKEITYTNSYVDLLKTTHRRMNEDQAEFEILPDNEDQIAQYMLLLDLMGFDDYETLGISEDLSKIKLTVQTIALDTKKSYEMEARSLAWLKKNTPDLDIYALGGAFTWPHIFSKALFDLVEGALYALMAISLILVFAFRSLLYGVISIIPNLFPALVVFGLWGYLVGRITFIEACVLSITIGIVVDDTVHFVSKYMTHRKMGYEFEESIIKTFESVGTALVITTVTFTLGLFIFFVSYLADISLMIKLMVPILYMALILDFFFLPTILLRVERFIARRKKAQHKLFKESY